MTFIDILKITPKDRKKKVNLQNAFAKIITQRMPEFKQILSAFGWEDPEYGRLIDLYYNNAKSKHRKPIPKLDLTDLAVVDAVQHPIFESVRNDRLKLELLVDYDIESPSWKDMDDYALVLRSIEIEIVLTLGDRQIFTKTNRYHSDFYKVLIEISELNHNREMWKSKNIYTTNRFNGLSIRSYIYTRNKIADSKPLSETDIDLGGSFDPSEISFSEFLYSLTGNNLLNYGGSQSKLFKKAKKYNWDKAGKDLLKVRYKNVIKKIAKKGIGKIIGNNNLTIDDLWAHQDDTVFKNLEEAVKYLEHYSESDQFKFNIRVWNRFDDKPKRTLITREEKVPDKEKGDWKASFPAVELTIDRIQVDIIDKSNKSNIIGGFEFKDKRFFERLKANKFFNSNPNVHGNFVRNYYDYNSVSEGRQRSKDASMRGSPSNEPSNERYKEFIEGRMTIRQFTDYSNKTPVGREKQQQWRKKLRRKQIPSNLVYVLLNNKWTLHDTGKLAKRFQIKWGGSKGDF